MSLIPWPTGSKWHCFIPFSGSLINHVSTYHDQQEVSDTVLFLFQAFPSVMSHPMTNSKWVTLLYFLAGQSHQSCFILWSTESEWHCFALFLCPPPHQPISIDCESHKVFYQLQVVSLPFILWPTVSEWTCHLCKSLLVISQTESEWSCSCFSLEHITWWPTASVWYNYWWPPHITSVQQKVSRTIIYVQHYQLTSHDQ